MMTLGPVMVGVMGVELQAHEREMLCHPMVGGVVLFKRNYQSPEQLMALVNDIHALREPHLLIAVDQEGGRVQRFRQGFTELPPLARLGELYEKSPERALTMADISGWLMAAEIRSVGIDISFAPVLDLMDARSRIIGDRAFHRDPEIVSKLSRQYVKGMHRAGMAATGKHFPGHGTVVEDSHLELPVDSRRFEDLMLEDLIPFERAVHSGVEAMMIAHIHFSRIDDQLPGFSTFWLQQVLRERFGFQGVIFSDDLEMQGATVVGDIGARVHKAIDAGCDMVLVCQTADAMAQAIDSLSAWNNPAAQLRFVRMHGRPAADRQQLLHMQEWKDAVRQVLDYDEPHTLDLI